MVSSRILSYLPAPRNWIGILLGVLGLFGLYLVSRHSFLLFHCLTETFSIVVALAVFSIFWNTRRFLESGLYMVLGAACLFAGVLDLFYIFAFKVMSAFPGADANIALQARVVAHWCISASCLYAFLFLRRRINQGRAFLVYGVLLALALGTIFYWRVFPDCYREGVGQTLFARMGFVMSCAAYLGALVLLVARRTRLQQACASTAGNRVGRAFRAGPCFRPGDGHQRLDESHCAPLPSRGRVLRLQGVCRSGIAEAV